VYRLYDPIRKKIILSRDVVFDEIKIGYNHVQNENIVFEDPIPLGLRTETADQDFQSNSPDLPSEDPSSFINDSSELPGLPEPVTPTSSDDASSPVTDFNARSPINRSTVQPRRRYSIRNRQPSTRFVDFWTFASEIFYKPLSFSNAQHDTGWRMAIQSEVDSINQNHTWTLVERPPDKPAISAKWIFKAKRGPTCNNTKLKSRLVARGFQ
jgi:hypothetical protein